jgi:outer membrane protein
VVIRFLGIALAAVLVGGLLAAPAVAADAPPLSLGYVDVQEVFGKYEKTKTCNADLEAYAKQLEQTMQAIAPYKLLDDNEFKELMDLVAKPNPTDKDKERLAALEGREKALDKELKDLQANKEPTELEKARLKELQDKSAKADDEIAKLSDQYDNQFNAKKDELSKQIRDDILKAIDAIAKQKALNLVMDKVAVLYGGVDITQPVIENLNGKK